MRRVCCLLLLCLSSVTSVVDVRATLTKSRLTAFLECASMSELADTIIEDVASVFPELRPSTDRELIHLKREFFLALVHTRKEMQSLANSTTNYKRVLAKLRKAAKLEMEKKPEYKGLYVNEDSFLMDIALTSAISLQKRREEDFQRRMLDKDQIEEEIAEKEFLLQTAWYPSPYTARRHPLPHDSY